MPTIQEEHAALVERILKSDLFKGEKLNGLLEFLYKNRSRYFLAREIEKEFYGVDDTDHQHNPSRSRVQIGVLKDRLDSYAQQTPDEKWRCKLPDATGGKGYQLNFSPAGCTASELFWKAHSDMADDVFVVCGSHLFFHDPSNNSALRYYDFNEDRDRPETMEKFKIAHPEAYKPDLQPWYHSYLSSGEVRAYEAMECWFHRQAGVLLQRVTSRETPESRIHKSSPILFGRPGTNKFIRKIMDSRQAAHLGYRIHPTLGALRIDKVSDTERRALSEFPLTKDGILGPVPTWQRVFGLVTRLRNPSGYGVVTIISADSHANVVTQIVEALTNENLTKKLLERTEWSLDAEMPDSFEMLFSVELSPGGLEGEGQAELLCWRAYDKPKSASLKVANG